MVELHKSNIEIINAHIEELDHNDFRPLIQEKSSVSLKTNLILFFVLNLGFSLEEINGLNEFPFVKAFVESLLLTNKKHPEFKLNTYTEFLDWELTAEGGMITYCSDSAFIYLRNKRFGVENPITANNIKVLKEARSYIRKNYKEFMTCLTETTSCIAIRVAPQYFLINEEMDLVEKAEELTSKWDEAVAYLNEHYFNRFEKE